MVGNYDQRRNNRWVPGLVAVAFGGFLAWQAGVLPFEFGQTETGQLVTTATPPDFDAIPQFPDASQLTEIENSAAPAQTDAAAADGIPENPFGDNQFPPQQSEPEPGGEVVQAAGTFDAEDPFAKVASNTESNSVPVDNPFEENTGTSSQAETNTPQPNPFRQPATNLTTTQRTPPPTRSAANQTPDFEDPFADPFAPTAANETVTHANVPPAQNSFNPEPGPSRTEHSARPIQQASASRTKDEFNTPRNFSTQPQSRSAELAPTDASLDQFLARVDKLIQEDDYLTAHAELSKTYWAKREWRAAIRTRIEKTARAIYAAPQPHYVTPYVVQPGDQLRLIAKRYKVPWQYLARLNQVDERKVRAGQKLKVNKGPFNAVVDLSNHDLTLHAHGYYVHSYKVGIGKDGSSPVGEFAVKQKVLNPTYYGRDGVIDADDPANPLGEHWIDIGDGFGIHGTIDPDSIGQSKSRGCIRMRNNEVAEVFQMLSVDSTVRIRR